MINWLENWLINHFDEFNESEEWIQIDTLDNPGWTVSIDTVGTELCNKPFMEVDKDAGDADWIICRTIDNKFEGFGDPQKLGNILKIFQEWSEQNLIKLDFTMTKWIEQWYLSHCDDSWEHSYGVKIKTISNANWAVLIDVMETELENKKFSEIKNITSQQDWIECNVENGIFNGKGDAKKLMTILNIFKKWTEL